VSFQSLPASPQIFDLSLHGTCSQRRVRQSIQFRCPVFLLDCLPSIPLSKRTNFPFQIFFLGTLFSSTGSCALFSTPLVPRSKPNFPSFAVVFPNRHHIRSFLRVRRFFLFFITTLFGVPVLTSLLLNPPHS